MRFDFGGLNSKKFGSMTQKKFLKLMRSEGYLHILAKDPDRTEKLKDAHRLMKAANKIPTVEPD